MAQSLALNQQGATPKMSVYKPAQTVGVLAPKTPPVSGGPKLVTNPLGNPSSGIVGAINKTIGLAPKSNAGMSIAPTAGTNPGMIQPPKAATPLKKTTTNNVDGSSVVHEYHAPDVATPAKTIPETSTPAPAPQPTNPYTPGNTSQSGFIGNLAQQGTTNSPQLDEAYKTKQNLQESYAKQQSALQGTPIPLEFQQGRGQVLANQYGTQLNAAETGISNALAQKGQQIQANTSAASLTAPTSQFGILTNPQTGQIIGGEGSNAQQLMGTSLQKALGYIKSGSSFEDAINTSGLGQFGDFGKSLLSSAISSGDSSFSPTSYGTQVSANQSNLASTQNEALKLNTNLQQVDRLAPVVTDFLQKSGINPFDAQLYNGPVNDYLKQIGNSGAATQWAALMGDLKNFTSQILSSGYGGTPTGTENATLSQDPSNLSYNALQSYLQTLKDLGGNRLATLQGIMGNLGGTSVGYTGSPASTVTSTTPATPAQGEVGTGITSPIGQLTAGLVLDKVPDIAKGVGNLAKGAAQGLGGAGVLKFIMN